MPEARVRFVEFERGQIDMETGEFPMILASDGEASDGDILSIEGAQFAAHAPLQISHINDPRNTLGTVSGFRRDLQSTPKLLRARGQIELGGDGPGADIRRDLAYMVQQGHVNGISVRWEPMEWQRRAELPPESPYYVDPEKEKNPAKRYGLYFKRWRVLEGSVVAIQADKAAMIGRAEQTEGAVSAFWRAMVEDAKPREEIEAHEPLIIDPQADAPKPDLDEAAKRAIVAARLREMQTEFGLSPEQITEEIEAQRQADAPPTPEEVAALFKRTTIELEAMRKQLASLEVGRVRGAPASPLHNVAEIVNRLDSMLEASNRRALATAQTIIEMKIGKINPKLQSYREVAHAEADALIREKLGPRPATDLSVEVLGGMIESMQSMIAAAQTKLTPPQGDSHV